MHNLLAQLYGSGHADPVIVHRQRWRARQRARPIGRGMRQNLLLSSPCLRGLSAGPVGMTR